MGLAAVPCPAPADAVAAGSCARCCRCPVGCCYCCPAASQTFCEEACCVFCCACVRLQMPCSGLTLSLTRATPIEPNINGGPKTVETKTVANANLWIPYHFNLKSLSIYKGSLSCTHSFFLHRKSLNSFFEILFKILWGPYHVWLLPRGPYELIESHISFVSTRLPILVCSFVVRMSLRHAKQELLKA